MAAEQFISKYTSTEIEEMLDKVKQDMTVINYTQSEIVTLLQKIDNFVAPTVPSKVSDLQNDSNFITNTVNNLTNYYTKTNTYTKTEVDNLISQHASGGFIVVQELPTTNISTKGIYLVPSTTTKIKNIYDEYINLDGTTNGWEIIGDTKINLSGYVTTEALNTALNAYVTSESLSTTLSNYVTSSGLSTTLADYVLNQNFQNTLNNYYTKTQVDKLLNPPTLYTIIFNGNTATGSKSSIEDKEADDSTTLGDSTGFTTPENKTFTGWALNSSESDPSNIFNSNDTVENVVTAYLVNGSGTEITLYAIWTETQQEEPPVTPEPEEPEGE